MNQNLLITILTSFKLDFSFIVTDLHGVYVIKSLLDYYVNRIYMHSFLHGY